MVYSDEPDSIDAVALETGPCAAPAEHPASAPLPSDTLCKDEPSKSPGETTLVRYQAGTAAKLFTLPTAHLRSPHSRRAYDQAIRGFRDWYIISEATAIDKSSVLAYVGELNRLKMAPATIKLALCAIRMLVAELAERRLISIETAAAIMRIKSPRARGVRFGRWLDSSAAERLLQAPDASTLNGKRDHALLAVLIGAGLRESEVVRLNVEHLQARKVRPKVEHLQQHKVRWVIADLIGKGDRVRSIPVEAWTKEAIDQWINAAGIQQGLIFRRVDKAGTVHERAISPNAVYEIVCGYAAAIGIPVAPHDLRRTFAKLSDDGGADLAQIQMSLGHSSITTTERYLGVNQDLSDAPCDHLGLNI